MVASYPTSVRSYVARVDLVDTVIADNVNSLQEEVVAIEATLGSAASSKNPLVSVFGATAFTTTMNGAGNTAWSTVYDRINNIENGLTNGVASAPYVNKNGGSTISTASVLGLKLQTVSGTSNLLESYSSAPALGFNLNSSGIPKVGTANVVYVGSTEYTTLVSNTTAANTNADSRILLSTVTTAGDLIVGSGASTVTRLGRGTSGQALIMSGTSLVWGAPVDATKIPLSTVTTAGDLIIGSAASAVARLGIGASGTFLSSNGTTAIWAAAAITAAGVTNINTALTDNTTLANSKVPLSTVTTSGDLILGTGNATVTRLGRGSSGQALVMNGTSVVWATPTDTSKIPLSTVTTTGDLIVANGASSVTRIGIGSNGQVLTSNGTTATWATTATPYVNQSNGTVTTASTSAGVVRNVWVSTSTSPAGGIDGDIWIAYT